MIEALVAELTGGSLVTEVLERRAGGSIRAEVVDGCPAPTPDTLARLSVAPDALVACRSVRLLRGDRLLSEAYNWFVPSRLTPAMQATLTNSDRPFGAVIAALSPRREALACDHLVGDPVLAIRALVRSGDGHPLAEVYERYRRTLLD